MEYKIEKNRQKIANPKVIKIELTSNSGKLRIADLSDFGEKITNQQIRQIIAENLPGYRILCIWAEDAPNLPESHLND
jgi:hypothetical protein